eukprot:GEMP01016006.1.p1 GENE.GEMP01016006.1~~GEMP01016006.1.p1  ORF type:complete len:882 (-),score=164.58 GEMP01016006.1:228-2873(-)
MAKGADGKFFNTTKRGEIHELKEELHSRDAKKRQEAVKKVIAAMTVGKDVSALFTDVIQCLQTTNVELKKLVYLYVINYAKSQPELAILVVSTFCKDSQDQNPLIRALAVRTMGCIRLDQITEYLMEPLRRCCQDPDPYVRKTCAICIPKMYEINPTLAEEQSFVPDILHDMLGDSSPVVVANAVASLTELSLTTGRDLLQLESAGTCSKLLAALNECTEWGQVFILDALSAYHPKDPREAETVIDRVTARLSHANPAVVLAAIKVVLSHMDLVSDAELVRGWCKKLNPPLVTLLSSEPEIQYVALRNIKLIVQKRPNILTADVKIFFCKYNDPTYVKLEKIDVMVQLVTDRNVEAVLNELKEYASGVEVEIARTSIRAIGRCALRMERTTERCVSTILELVELKNSVIIQEAVCVIKDVFRKYPTKYEQVIAALCENLDLLDEAEAKASMIWILGEYAERIEKVEEILDSFLDDFHDESSMVQCQLLTAITKLFLKLPAQGQEMVTRILKMATEESLNPDLRDRGYIYWRLLSTNPEATKLVVLNDKPAIVDEVQMDKALLSTLCSELSLFSSVYHLPAEDFITRVQVHTRRSFSNENNISEESEDEYKERVAKAQQALKEAPNLLDIFDEPASTPPASSPTPKVVVLRTDTKGQSGVTGFGVEAAVDRQDGVPKLFFTFENATQAPLSTFAIQFNKNAYGLAPSASLADLVQSIAPGEKKDIALPLVAGQLLSDQPMTNPLVLQVAVKNDKDVFYFNVPMDLKPVLSEEPAMERDNFSQKWQALGDQGQQAQFAHGQVRIEAAIETLKQKNIHYVAQRAAENADSVYFACSTIQNQTIVAEVSIQRNGDMVKVATRTQQPQVAIAFNTTVINILRLTPR